MDRTKPQFTTQAIPVPPIPVKSIHINETINGVNQQVPFQIEDWASGYTVPLGLSSNTTIFGNRQMIVFLVNTHVSDFTLWWDGSDQAVQTPLAFTNKYFTGDDPSGQTLTNGHLTLHVTDTGKFNVTSTVGSSTSKTTFMNINGKARTTVQEKHTSSTTVLSEILFSRKPNGKRRSQRLS